MICKNCKHKECDLVFGNICTYRVHEEHKRLKDHMKTVNMGEAYYVCDSVKECKYKERV